MPALYGISVPKKTEREIKEREAVLMKKKRLVYK
jgi:hypothetical protein